MNHFRRTRGFTLLEMVVVIAIVAIMAAVTVQLFSNWIAYDKPRRSARLLLGDVNRARSYAASGFQPSGAPGWAATDRTVNAGIIISATNAYTVFVDRNGITDGDEYPIAVVTLPDPVTISAPAVGQEVRFRQNGMTSGPSVDLVVTDTTMGVNRSITVSGAGLAWVN